MYAWNSQKGVDMFADNSNYVVGELQFVFYSSDDIRRLSVKEILNPQTFDDAQQPLQNGLYDAALGPTEHSEQCATCSLGRLFCPGHMGHIELPVTVYHPLFFDTIFMLLKSSCLGCYHIAVDPKLEHIFINQCRLLDKGRYIAFGEILDLFNHSRDKPKDELFEILDEFTEKALKDDSTWTESHLTRNKKELRNTLVKGLQKKFKTTGKCQNCGMYKKQLRKEHKAKIVVVASTKVVTDVDKKKASENESRQSNDEESDSDTDDDEKPSAVVKAVSDVNFMPPAQVKGILREVWKFHKEMLLRLFPFFENSELEYPTDVFFLETVGVPGNKYRPISEMNDMRFEHTQTANLHRVLNGCVDVREIMQEMRILETQPSVGQKDNRTQKPIITRLSDAMVMLQRQVNITFDQRSDTGIKDAQPGIRQMLESKEGLFRKNIMGKRVNHACRSVISPDPNIATNEIGIPEVFAKSLTFPQPVTPWNVHELRQAVKNGPDKHPGAVSVVNELGQEIMLNFKDKTRREAIAKQLLTPPTTSCKQALLGVKTVNRHLKNGDLLLLNRQPTLHRPSIQGHMARVLKGEKTMRLNYMNCKAYNADFDGDEMSAHFPQSELCRAEAFHIASTDFQYLSPKDGTPLAGLMQDHIVSGVHLSIRGKFFCKEDYCNLVNSAVFDNQGPIKILPPTIWKPYRAYTGKQVISSVILNIIPEDKLKLSFNGKAKVPEKSWLNTKVKQQTPAFMGEGDVVIRQGELLSWLNTKVKQQTPAYMGESDVVIRQGELLVGILDKQHLGATSYGLVHCVNELYGGRIAGRLLTCLGRLFLCFLKIRGFTLGVEDILVKDKGDQDRRKIIKKSLKVGTKAAVKAFNLPEDAKPEEIRRAYQDAHFDRDERQLRELDITMRGQTNDVQNSIVNVIMPPGLIKQFPSNNLQLMVKSGSKGSMVNTMQISCLLGQIELEGRRPPLMVSGKTLPSFCAYDISPRAGGFVSDRFLTGVRPQEYFFHCMAGREGLVDTAVKTSRSGYLQRCIIKFLEGIKVAYDSSVRDSDNSIIQFQYGEDGLDVCKACFLNPKQLSFVTENTAGLKKESHQTNDEVETVKKEQKKNTAGLKKDSHQTNDEVETVKKEQKRVSKWKKTNKREKGSRHSDFLEFSKSADVEESETFVPGRNGRAVALCEKWRALSTKKQNKYSKLTKEPDPILSRFWPHQKRVFPEKLYELFLNFSDKNLKQVDKSMSKEDFLELMDAKVKESLAVPGEAVGLVCAQSIGEPSTQMTLNTFHFAGRGEMNMTLGIPRLRELLMTGSKMIKTPAIDVPVRPGKEAKDTVTKLQKWLNRVYLSEVLEEAEVSTWLSFQGQRARMYKIKFKFLHQDCYKQRFSIRPQFTIQAIETKFFKQLVEKIRYRMSKLSEARNLKSNKQQADRPVEPDNDEQFLNEPDMADKPATTNDADADADGSDDNDAAGADADEYSMRLNKKHQDEQEYEDEEELDDDGVAVEMEIDESGTLGVDMEYDRRKRAEPSSDEDEGDVEESLIRMKEARFKVKDSRNKRINTVLLLAKEIVDYKYDFKKHQQCELTLSFPLQDNQLDISTIIKDLAQKTIIHQVPGISKCFLGEQKGEDGMELHLKTEGINIEWVCKHSKVLDLNRLYCNNIYTVEKTYGIEAARNVIIKEMQSVFGAYGIDVNYRHLSLLSDYMTFEGTYKPFTRMTMASNASPLQRMTYETSMQFLMDACINAEVESLNSPSAQITVGKNITCGTGSVDMMVPLTF